MLEYMRQEPPGTVEYYQCDICHEEKHINNLKPPDYTDNRIICHDCLRDVCSHEDATPTSSGWKCEDCGRKLP